MATTTMRGNMKPQWQHTAKLMLQTHSAASLAAPKAPALLLTRAAPIEAPATIKAAHERVLVMSSLLSGTIH